MGFLTTFTINNDSLVQELSPENAENFCENLRNHAEGLSETVDSGNLIMQQSRHANDHTIYIHMGNTVTEMNPYSETTRNSLNRNPDFFKTRLDYLKRQVRELTEMYRQHQKKS